MCDHSPTRILTKLPVRHRWGHSALALLLNGLCLLPAMAQAVNEDAGGIGDCRANEIIRFRGGTVRLENDVFAGVDENYTSGVAFTLTSHDMAGGCQPELLPMPVRLHAKLIKFMNPGFWSDAQNSTHTQNVVVKLGQSVFTPRDHARTDLILDDRPYAGLLYVGLSWNRRTHDAKTNLETLDTREITLGIIGPWSLAEHVQNAVHEVTGSYMFLGWQHQLRNEPAIQLAVDHKRKAYRGAGAVIPGLAGDAVYSAGLRLGNIETSATLGIEARIGWNLPNDFGSYPIRPGAENRPPSAVSIRGNASDANTAATRPRPGIHIFGMLETKLVAHDFSLDGNLFLSSHSVTRRLCVAQVAAGMSVHGLLAGHGVRLAVMRVYRSLEFEEQGSNQAHGSVALSFEF
ncbi:MAG: lipid A deacylase LpxR family protein [Kiritimatiellae bacterium]|nr:lipid A deacylase LpxR family protein [Kiritimatiellia bacterium]